MMQAESNLILSGISDTAVTGWVSRLWAKHACANAKTQRDTLTTSAPEH